MKILLSITLFLLTVTHTQAQTTPTDTAASMLKEFYTKYITAMDKGDLKAPDILAKKYCTPALLHKLPKLAEKIDADPIVKAQDGNIQCLPSLSITPDPKQQSHYIVSYIADKRKFTINVSVVLQNGSYKINMVW